MRLNLQNSTPFIADEATAYTTNICIRYVIVNVGYYTCNEAFIWDSIEYTLPRPLFLRHFPVTKKNCLIDFFLFHIRLGHTEYPVGKVNFLLFE